MTAEQYDFIVLGGGSAGYAGARTARENVERVAIVDGSQDLGGLCILRGCMPSKTLIYTAEVLHRARHAERLGLRVPSAEPDMARVQARKKEVIEDFAGDRREQLESDRFDLYRNHARFVDERTLELDDGRRLRGGKILIATGSAVATPPVPGLREAPFWTSDDILELDFLPEKTIVLGGGIVACELAQCLRRMGTEIIQIQRSPHILKEVSPEAAGVVENVFRDEGIQLYTDTRLEAVETLENGFKARFRHAGETLEVEAPHLFNALGRRAATERLNLEAAGIETARNGQILCNDAQRTSNPEVYAAGDCAGPHEIVHVAVTQGEIAARHACGRTTEPVDYDRLLGVIFTDPQIGTVGLGARDLEARGIDYLSADAPFDDHGKSILMEAKAGYVRVFAERAKGTVLGAECVGREGGELIHALSVAVALKATVFDLLATHWYHPTLSEIWTYPLEDIAEAIQTRDAPRE